MTLALLTSAAHSPGVSSLGVALAVNSPGPALLVDANRRPDQSVLAGFLTGSDPAGRGLGSLLQAYRERRALRPALASMLVELAEGADFLPGFAHPGVVALFQPVWPEFAAALDAQDRTVLVDAGEVGPEGPPLPLISVASQVAVVTRSSLPDVAALRLYLPHLIDLVGPERVGLIVVGPGRPYSAAEICSQLGVALVGTIAWDPTAASVYSHGAAPGRRHSSSAYLNDVRAMARALAGADLDRPMALGVGR